MIGRGLQQRPWDTCFSPSGLRAASGHLGPAPRPRPGHRHGPRAAPFLSCPSATPLACARSLHHPRAPPGAANVKGTVAAGSPFLRVLTGALLRLGASTCSLAGTPLLPEESQQQLHTWPPECPQPHPVI